MVDIRYALYGSGGVSSTLCPVNSESKYRVSVAFDTCGLYGGTIRFFSRSLQLMLAKNWCALTSSTSLGPPPNRFEGSLLSKPPRKSLAAVLIVLGNLTFSRRMSSNSVCSYMV